MVEKCKHERVIVYETEIRRKVYVLIDGEYVLERDKIEDCNLDVKCVACGKEMLIDDDNKPMLENSER